VVPVKKVLCGIVVCVVILAFSGCAEEATLIDSHVSPDGNYSLSLYQVGSPRWSFGDVQGKLVLYSFDDATQVNEVSFSLSNDGTGVDANNIVEVDWQQTGVRVVLRHFDTAEVTECVLSYYGAVTNITRYVPEEVV